MVRRDSADDKLTFEEPIGKKNLVPWKQLASTERSPDTAKKKVFDFLENVEYETPPKRREPASTSSSTKSKKLKRLKRTDSLEQSSSGDDVDPETSSEHSAEGSSGLTDSGEGRSTQKISREVSPMQEKFLLENNWQENIVKMDELLSDISASSKGEFNEQLFIQTFKKKEILLLLFKLFDWEVKGKVTQEKIIESCKSTFRDLGGVEWVELLEVVAYVICEERDVTEPCFLKIFKSKGVVEKWFKYIVRSYGKESSAPATSRQQLMDLIANLTYARPRKGFSTDNLKRFESMFREALGAKQELTFEDFKKIVRSRNSFFAERVFEIFDRDKSGSVSLSEFLDAMHQFTGKSANDKIKFLFRVYDLDGDGLIQHDELAQVMKACMEENGMRFSNEQIEDLTMALFEDADTEQRGAITYEGLKAQLEKHLGLLENLSVSIDRWLMPPQPQVKNESFLEKLENLRPYQLTFPYLRNNYVYLTFLMFFISVNLGLFIDRALTIYRQGHNILYILARASGQCLNFNCAFVLVLILRQSITFLRARGASFFLPLDQHLYFHKMCGWVILFHSLLHTIMHLINFPINVVPSELNPEEYSAMEWLFSSAPGAFGLVPGWANPTGLILIVVILIMVISSLPFVRKSGYFEVFYWTHLLYVVFWGLTILHGPHFWKWFIGPAVLFTFEKVYRFFKMKTGQGKTYISSGVLLPSKVIHLVIQKPAGFHYHPGDYVFINIPTIATYEWHPFTISSAPEQNGAVWLHIRAVGEWTSRLYNYFEAQQLQCDIKKKAKRKTLSVKISNRNNVVIGVEDEKETNNRGDLAITDIVEKDDKSDRKNGIVNVAYESETNSTNSSPELGTNSADSLDLKKNSQINRSFNTKSKANGSDLREDVMRSQLVKTNSVPDFEVNFRNKNGNFAVEENNTNAMWVASPSDVDEMFEIVDGKKMKKIMFPANQSVAMSVRYMRRKPQVFTLDVPEDIDETEDENDADDDAERAHKRSSSDEVDVEAPKPTAVRRASGRIFDRGSSRMANRNQRRKSNPEKRKSRRLSRLKEAENFGQCTIGKPLVILVDGPYGAPSSHIFRAQHAVLIATGIGVTPFASILQSIMHRYLKARQTCPKCEFGWTADIPTSVMNLRKVDFFWINRDQRSFEWFVNLLSQLEIEQAEQGSVLERFLDMHMYITSALQKTDMKAVGLQLALDLLHEKEKRDLITGLKTRTNAGRPNWDKVFKQLANQNKGKITVFYCGPPALGRTLRYKCDEYGFDFRKEIF